MLVSTLFYFDFFYYLIFYQSIAATDSRKKSKVWQFFKWQSNGIFLYIFNNIKLIIFIAKVTVICLLNKLDAEKNEIPCEEHINIYYYF